MLDIEFQTLSDRFPRGFRRDFDAHVYFTSENREKAVALRERAIQELSKYPVFISELEGPVGPHPTPTFEICFSTALFAEVFIWLLHSRGDLSVLVHEVTGNDPKDHSTGAVWLGEEVELDTSKF
jgi:DOPA 4,5-dioxygenase